MRSDKPFRTALLCAFVFTLVCSLFPAHHRSPSLRAALYFGAGSLVAALVTGTLAWFSQDSWSWRRIAVTFLAIVCLTAIACAMLLIFGSRN